MPSKKEAGVPQKQLKNLFKVARPISTTLTPLGTLSILPRELRDEIYSYLCSEEYQFERYYTEPNERWKSHNAYNLAMLGLPKSIRLEFLSVMYAEAVFCIWDGGLVDDKAWTRNEILFLDQIQKVEFSTTLPAYSDEACTTNGGDHSKISEMNNKLSGKDAAPVSFFKGTDVLRNCCIIKLNYCTPKAVLIFGSPLFDAIKRLTNFRNVTMVLSSTEWDWCPKDALTYIGGDTSCTDFAIGF